MAENMNDGDDSSMIETPLNCDPLIELEYPGVVKNVSKMLDTLGGEAKLSKVSNFTNLIL